MTTWKLVPVEPTEAMIKAVNAADSHSFELSWSEGYKAMLNAAPAPDVQPVAWVDLLKEADQIVKNKPTWKSFIDGTPLSNDIAVWMADFAQKYATPALDVEPAIYPEEARQMGLEEVPYYTHPPAADVRCEGCGYMTYHSEHIGCVRAAKQYQDKLTAPDVQELLAALMIIAGKQQCVDPLMSNTDIALQALAKWEGK